MTDRDHFAAAALTGLLSNTQRYQLYPLTRQAWEIADAMLRERERTDLDAAPAARAPTDASPLRPDQGVTVGMGTGDTQGPVAWAVMYPNGKGVEEVFECEADARDDASHDQEIVPLYRAPQTCPYVVGRTTLHCSLTPFTLTDQEREAIQWFSSLSYGEGGRVATYADTLRGMLHRHGSGASHE